MVKEEKKTVDFNKLRKRRQRVTTVKRLLVLGGILLLLFGTVFLNNLLVQESVTTRISDVVQSLGGTGFPVPVPGGVIRDVKSNGDYLAVLNDANLYVYNTKGKQMGNFQQMSDSSVLVSTSGRLLTYTANGKQLRIHSRSRTLLEQELEYAILTAAMNERGDYAVASSSKQSICEVVVYNKRFEEIYRCYFASNLVSSVSLSPKGAAMATGWVNAQDGVLLSGVNIYRFSSDQAYAEINLVDHLVLDVDFQEEDRVWVLTDRQVMVMGADGTVRSTYDFGGRQLRAVERSGRQTLLLLEDAGTRRRDVVLLDADLQQKADLSTTGKVLDIAIASRRVYLLGEGSIETLNLDLEQQSSEPVQNASRIRIAGKRLYYLTDEDIRILGQTVPVDEEEFDFDSLEAEPDTGPDPERGLFGQLLEQRQEEQAAEQEEDN